MKKIILNSAVVAVIAMAGMSNANAQAYTFYRIIDTLVTVTAPCTQDIYNSPAYADITFSGPTQVLQVDNAYSYTYAYQTSCGGGTSCSSCLRRDRFFVIDGAEQKIQDNYLGNIWFKAGSKLRVKIYSPNASYLYPGSNQTYTVKISAVEYKDAD